MMSAMRGLVGATAIVAWLGSAAADPAVVTTPEQHQQADQLFEEGRKLLVETHDPGAARAKSTRRSGSTRRRAA